MNMTTTKRVSKCTGAPLGSGMTPTDCTIDKGRMEGKRFSPFALCPKEAGLPKTGDAPYVCTHEGIPTRGYSV